MKIVAICSGGIDSVGFTSKFLNNNEIYILTFNYGQKAQKEIESVKKIYGNRVKEIKIVDITFMKHLWSNNQLTDEKNEIKNEYQQDVIVPLRNAIFTVIATAYAISINADKVILGSHMDDVTTYKNDFMFPDCDSRFFELLETALHLGHLRHSKKVEILTASRENLYKSDLIKIGYENLGDDIFETWSCYKSESNQCGICDSCKNRKNAFKQLSITDKTIYQN